MTDVLEGHDLHDHGRSAGIVLVREIADAMGTTVPGVESLIQRALAGLRSDLAGKVEWT